MVPKLNTKSFIMFLRKLFFVLWVPNSWANTQKKLWNMQDYKNRVVDAETRVKNMV